jgi:hypothetical protein
MPREDFERYRQRLEEQLRADMGLLYEAYLAKLRAYQSVERLREDGEFPTAAGLSIELPPIPGPDVPPAALRPAAPPRRSRSYEVVEAVQDALPRLPEVFDRFDVLAAFDFEPRRSTLLQALQNLRQEGVLSLWTTLDSRGFILESERSRFASKRHCFAPRQWP